jgi:hypothetical protein
LLPPGQQGLLYLDYFIQPNSVKNRPASLVSIMKFDSILQTKHKRNERLLP